MTSERVCKICEYPEFDPRCVHWSQRSGQTPTQEVEALFTRVHAWQDRYERDWGTASREQANELLTVLGTALRSLAQRLEEAQAELGQAINWNHRVSVCKDHAADIVDGECVICELSRIEAETVKHVSTFDEAINYGMSLDGRDNSCNEFDDELWDRARASLRAIRALLKEPNS